VRGASVSRDEALPDLQAPAADLATNSRRPAQRRPAPAHRLQHHVRRADGGAAHMMGLDALRREVAKWEEADREIARIDDTLRDLAESSGDGPEQRVARRLWNLRRFGHKIVPADVDRFRGP
jgi:hypothetical protein